MVSENEDLRIKDLDSMLESFYNLTLEKQSGTMTTKWLGVIAFVVLAFGVAFNTFQWREHATSGDHAVDHALITRELASQEARITTLENDVSLLKSIKQDVQINQKLLKELQQQLKP